MLKKYPVHSFLLGLFPVLFLFVNNLGQANWSDMLLPMVVIELMVSIMLLIAYWISKNWIVSGIYVSVLLVWFYSYGYFYNIFIGLTINNAVLGRERWLIPIWGASLIAGLIWLMRFRRFSGLNRGLNIIVPVLLGLLMLKIGMYYYQPHAIERKTQNEIQSETHRLLAKGLDNAKPQYLPSIYYVILDAYSASSNLKDLYGYDNVQFISYLKKKGFYIAEKSCSNYAVTGLSLHSSLNLNYLNAVYNLSGLKKRESPIIDWSYEDSEIIEYLKQRGYRIVKLGSWWSPTATEKRRTGLIGYVATEFNIVLLQMTILRPIVHQLMSSLLRRGIIDVFEKTADLARSDKPHFVFSHIICPHPPFVFGANGEKVGLMKSLAMRLHPGMLYLDQVKYINKRVELLVDKILKDSNSPPIIILQADHGHGFIFHPLHNRNIPGYSKEDLKFLKAQFKILNAYYLPNGGEKYLYDNISPVNTFRVILNTYFGEHLELLPDRSYYSNYIVPFEFLDVTDRVKD